MSTLVLESHDDRPGALLPDVVTIDTNFVGSQDAQETTDVHPSNRRGRG